MFKGKNLLITGGTGSFGNAVLRKFLTTEIKEIRIFSRDEKKQDDMRKKYKDEKIKFHLGDVRDPNSLRDVMRGVDFVFHAAALKQVPSCEFYPMQAVQTNIIGTENVLNAAIDAGVRKIICLSTDKAVYPINAMGISKAMLEKVAIAKSRNLEENKTQICCTRYGNVMASRGSVIPLFIEQLKVNTPRTSTDPTRTRFMMSLDQAVDLVTFCFKHGRNGDIFVQKSPAATIEVLVEAIKILFNKKDHVTKIIGTRHGEKLYETLLTREEKVRATEIENYYRIPADSRDLNYGKFFEEGQDVITQGDEYTSHNTYRLSVDEVINMLKDLYELKPYFEELGIN
ncbi:MAG: polysaccharide biosynthesis protein [Mobilitalea sp.]